MSEERLKLHVTVILRGSPSSMSSERVQMDRSEKRLFVEYPTRNVSCVKPLSVDSPRAQVSEGRSPDLLSTQLETVGGGDSSRVR